MKKITAFILALVMAVAMVPSYVLHTEAAKKTIKVKSIKINKTTVSVAAGNQIKLKASLSPVNTTQKILNWSSSKKKIATVSENGVVTAVKPGTATITVKVKGTSKKATCKITVTKAIKVKKITLNKKSLSMQAGSKATLKASLTPKNTTQKTIAYKSSDPSVAKVSKKGVVTAVKKGSVTITATIKGTSKKVVCKVTVTAKKKVLVTAVKFAKKKLALKQGEAAQMKATVSPSNATNKAVTYKSSNTNVATVDVNGRIQAKSVGETVITATAKDGSKKKATMTVAVAYVQSRFVITYETGSSIHPFLFGTKENGTIFTVYESDYLSYNNKKAIGSKKEVKNKQTQLTFTIESALPQNCYLGVNYSGLGKNMNDTLNIADMGVKVEAWQGDKKVASYTAPDKKGNEWIAAGFESMTGKFTEISKAGTSGNSTDFYREFYYGDLVVTAIKTNSYITRAEINDSTIYLVSSSSEFVKDMKNYLNQIVPVIKDTGSKYVVEYNKKYDYVSMTLTDSSGKVRTYDVLAKQAAYDELRVLEVTSGNGSLQNYEIRETAEEILLYLTTLDCADAELSFKTTDATVSLKTNYDRDTIELTGKNGIKKQYYLYCIPDYEKIYGNLKVSSVQSTDNRLSSAQIYDNYIYLTGTATSLEEIMDHLQFTIAMPGATWEYQESEGDAEDDVRYLKLESPTGVSRIYMLYYGKNYTEIYNGLELTDVTSTDGSVLACSITTFSVELFLTKELDEIEDQIRITTTKTRVTWSLDYDEDDGWTLTLQDDSGTTRQYKVNQNIDYDIRYGNLKVTDITSSKVPLTACDITHECIYLKGTVESLQVEDLKVVSGQKGITLEWEEGDEDNTWMLTLTGSDGTERSYEVCYEIDTNAVYGDLKVTQITAKDPDVITYLYIDGADINLGLQAQNFDDIKDTLSVELADENATWNWVYDENGAYRMQLQEKDGMTRIYDIYWYTDYEAIYGALGIAEVACDDDRVTEIYIDDTTVILTATSGTLDDVRDLIDVTLSDETATWDIAYEEDTCEWKVILTGANGTQRRYAIWYNVYSEDEIGE